jgi:hypothetical protein
MKKKRPARGNAGQRESASDPEKPGPILFSFDGREIEVVFDLPEDTPRGVIGPSQPSSQTQPDSEGPESRVHE